MSATRWHAEEYFEGWVAGIMNYETAALALAATSRNCLNQKSEVVTLSNNIATV